MPRDMSRGRDTRYSDDGVVYTVWMSTGNTFTGRFLGVTEDGFWTMETVGDGDRNAADWMDLNPAHIMAVYAAAGRPYRKFMEAYGEEA